MKRVFFFLLSSILFIDLSSQTVWENNFGLPDSTFAIDIQQTSDGNYLLYGGTYDNSPTASAFLLKFNEDGDSLWMKSYDMEPVQNISMNWFGDPILTTKYGSLIIDQNDQFLICGSKLVKTDAIGSTLWEEDIQAHDIALKDDGTIFAIDFSTLHKLTPGGMILESVEIGSPIDEFSDSLYHVNHETGGLPYPFPIPMDTYTNIELFGDTMLILYGARIVEEANETKGNCLTNVIRESTLSSSFSDLSWYDLDLPDLGFLIRGSKLNSVVENNNIHCDGVQPVISGTSFFNRTSLENQTFSAASEFEYIQNGQGGPDQLDVRVNSAATFINESRINIAAHFAIIENSPTWEVLDKGNSLVKYNESFDPIEIKKFYIGSISETDFITCLYQDSQEHYFIGGNRDSYDEIFGHWPRFSKTDNDFFIARIDSLEFDIGLGNVTCSVYLDENGNGSQDNGEQNIGDASIFIDSEFIGSTNPVYGVGHFVHSNDIYTVSAEIPFLESNEYTFTSVHPLDLELDPNNLSMEVFAKFGIQLSTTEVDIGMGLSSNGINPGFEFMLNEEILGIMPSGYDSVRFQLDYDEAHTNFVSSQSLDIVDDGSVLTWLRTEDQEILQENMRFRFQANTSLPDSVLFDLRADHYLNGIQSSFLNEELLPVTGSFDPNDKLVSPAGIGPEGLIPPETDRLTYTIRFQNTGTDTTHFIRIHDPIDTEHLDMDGFQMIASSHEDYSVNFVDGELRWLWDPIHLPDSAADLLGSQGFVQFSIPLRDDVQSGDVIQNEASIYFDFNEPIVTPQVSNTIYTCAAADLMTSTSYCTGDPLQASNLHGGGIHTWSIEGYGTFIQEEAPVIELNTAGDLWIHLQVEDTVCSSISLDSLQISVSESPFGSLITQSVNDLFVTSDFNVQWYLNGSAIPGADQLTYEISQDGDYQVEFINGDCSSFSEVYAADFYVCASGQLQAQTEYCVGDTLVAQNLNSGGTSTWIVGQVDYQQDNAPLFMFTEPETIWLYLSVEDEICQTTHIDSVLLTIEQAAFGSLISQAGNILSVSTDSDVQWYLNGSAIPGANQLAYEISQNGDYQVEFINGNCTSFSTMYTAVLSGIEDLISTGDIQLTQEAEALRLQWHESLDIHRIRLIDIQGRELEGLETRGSQFAEIGTNNLPEGAYILLFDSSERILGMVKIKL